ncbi:hypothetical protein GUF49_04715, partial [Xanthomonas citri pv. citri]|nr:hypothetical protein [Xanthomonas citri pv. citri]
SHVHAGFGLKMSASNQAEQEPPHIAFPLFAAASQLVVTKAGSATPPPPLGSPLPESAAEAKARIRRAVNAPGELCKGDTV